MKKIILVILLFILLSGCVKNFDNSVVVLDTGTAINVYTANIIKPVNKRIFGTNFPSLGREQWRIPEDINSEELKNLLHEVFPAMITIANAQFGFPFFVESTGNILKRMGTVEMLLKIGPEDDEEGKIILSKLMDDPFYNKNQPPNKNYDDLLQFIENYNPNSEISLRIPIIFIAQSGEFKKIKINLDAKTGADLVHYLNDDVTTEPGKLRAENGHPEPYEVKNFVLGNEFWANVQFNDLEIEQITSQIIAFSKAMKEADPEIRIGINLVDDSYPHEFFKENTTTDYKDLMEYNNMVLERVNEYIDFVTFHHYGNRVSDGDIIELNVDEWRYSLAQSYFEEKYDVANKHREIVEKYCISDIGIAEFSGPLGTLGGAIYNAGYIVYLLENDYYYATNHASGLFEPHTYFGLIKVSEQNDTPYIKNPNFYALKMFTNYFGDVLVETEVTGSPTFETTALSCKDYYNWPAEQDIPGLKVIASTEGNKVYLMVINRDLGYDIKANILLDKQSISNAKVYILNGPSINATNISDPENVNIKTTIIENASASFDYIFEKHSVTVIEYEISE